MTDLEYTLSLIPHFDYVHEHLFCSGQPSAEQLQLIKEYGCSTIINLAWLCCINIQKLSSPQSIQI